MEFPPRNSTTPRAYISLRMHPPCKLGCTQILRWIHRKRPTSYRLGSFLTPPDIQPGSTREDHGPTQNPGPAKDGSFPRGEARLPLAPSLGCVWSCLEFPPSATCPAGAGHGKRGKRCGKRGKREGKRGKRPGNVRQDAPDTEAPSFPGSINDWGQET